MQIRYFVFALLFLPQAVSAGNPPGEKKLVINLSFTLSNYNGFNVSCNGGGDGSIDLTPTDGVEPYTFLWSNGFTSEDLNGIQAGTYTVTVTDFNGDTQSGSVTLTEPAAIVATLDNVLPDSCGGGGSGEIYITTTGGVPGYTWLWPDGQLVEDPVGLGAGLQQVTISDANGCSVSPGFNVPLVDAMSLVLNATDVSCNGGANGAINLTVNAGTNPFTFQWSNSASAEDVSNLIAGTYTVTVTDADNCSVQGSAVVNEPTAINLSLVPSNILCNGAATGSIDLTVSGGTPGYSFLWSNGSVTEDPSGLIAGTYTVTVTDANTCTASSNTTITQLSALSLSTSVTDVACNGGTNGAINLTVSGGTPGYTYLWSNGSTLEDPSGLVAGTYTVTVTDANNCTAQTSAVVSQPAALSLSTLVSDVSCNGGNNGSINLTVSGGTGGYTYLWSNGSLLQDPTGLVVGTYTVTVTDANNCTAQTSAGVSQPTALSLSTVASNVTCNGGNNGSINLTVSGGIGGYTYLWSNGSLLQDPTGLVAGTYTVTVTDANNCTAQTSAGVSQPAALSLSTVVSNVTCNGGNNGSINLSVSGGTGGYTYLWSNGSLLQDPTGLIAGTYTVTVTDANNCTAQTSAGVTQATALNLSTVVTNVNCNGLLTGAINLTVAGGAGGYTYLWSNSAQTEDLTAIAAGTYTVTVTDANNCTGSTTASVTQPAALNLQTSVTAVTCNGGSTGAINLTVSGGTAGYTYLWSNTVTSQDLSNITAGTYTVTVTDANFCTATTSATITQPAALNLSTSVTNVACSGGSNGAVNLTVSGGTTNYTYLWSNGNNTEDISGLAAGTYTVTVTDANNCTATTSATVSQSGSLSLSFVPVNGTCNASNGSVTVIPTGGLPLYTYLWNTGASTQVIAGLAAGTYTVTVTDAALCSITSSVSVGNSGSPVPAINVATNVSCNGGNNGALDISVTGGTLLYTYLWNTGALTQDISGLTAGTYTVTVTDANFCVGTQSFVVTQPLVVGGSGVVSDVSCNGGNNGSVNLTPSGGTPGYTYLWSNGSTSQDPTGLSAGTYTVTITDANSCTGSRTFTVAEPSALAVTTSSTPSGCLLATGTATASGSGGAGGYTYSWSSGASTATANNLSAGVYTVTVSDINGCTIVDQVTVTTTNGPSISNAVVTNVTCNGGTDGGVNISVSGGTPGYSYNWNSGAVTQDISGVSAGIYTVTVTDANSCSASGVYTISQPVAIVAPGTIVNVSCNGGADGSIDITPTGGSGTYTYLWNTASVTQDISGLTAGSYSVTITDNNACTGTASFTITEPNAITLNVVVTDLACNNVATGSINLTVFGGTTPYTYLWSNGFTGQDPSGLLAGNYTVTVTDFSGCTKVRVVNVAQPAAITGSVGTTSASCGSANGTATVSASGGTGTLTYLWSNGQSTTTINGLTAGTYTVTVTDANGCSFLTSGIVSNANGPVISSAAVDSVNCFGGTDGSVNITISGGAPVITYLWSNGSTTQDISAVAAGTYSVTVTDANSCTATGSYIVHEPAIISLSLSPTAATCSQSNAALQTIVSGGTPGYTYLWSTGATTANLTGIPAAVYTVTVTDQYGCTRSSSLNPGGTTAPLIDSVRIQNVLCNGGATGSITLYVSGGTNPLSYLWSNGATTQNISGLTNGAYTVTITDGAGCTATRTNLVTQPQFLAAVVSTQPSFCGQATGQASVAVSGGVSPYTYLWSNTATTASITNLTAGTYTVTVTDANGCTRRRNAVVSLANGPVITLAAQTDVTCYGGSNGALDISISGGIQPYVYAWSNSQTTQDLSGLAAGTYTVIVSDSTLCSDSATFIISQPDSFTITPAITNSACGLSTGAISVSASGGTPGYSYSWSNGQTTSSITSLAAGTYTLTLTDNSGCDSVVAFTVGSLSGPQVVLDSVRNIRCFGINNGRIYISVTGGTAAFSYLWSDGNTGSDRFGVTAGTYTVTVTDAGGCTSQLSATVTANTQINANFSTVQASCGQANGSATIAPSGGVAPYTVLWETGSNALTITGLAAGIYSATITDSLGCVRADSVAVSNTGSPTVQLQSQVLPTCFGGNNGSLTIAVSGGTTPYGILWSNGSTTVTASGLASGTYAVTVTDGVGCIDVKTFPLAQPDSIQLQFTASNANCGNANGSAQVSVTGGTGSFAYNWSSGAVTASASSLVAGLYTVTVTDQNGCTNLDTVSIANIAGPDLTLDQITNVTCFNGADGAISVSVTGGATPLTYAWSSGQTVQDISGLTANTYTLIVSDLAGCKDTLVSVVSQPLDISIQPTVTDAACNNSNGAVSVVVSGGTAGYSYLWSTGATIDNIQNVPAGNYTVTVSDSKGCTKSQVIVVNNINGPSASTQQMVPVTCPGGNDGQLDINVSFGTPPFNYLWSTGATTQDLTGLASGIYTVTVTDFNSCITILTDTITQPDNLVITAAITTASCNLPNGIVTVQTTGGTSGYTYLWSNSAASSTITGLAAGNYTVTVTDAANCTKDTVISVTNSGVPQISLDAIDSVSCFGLADGSISLTVSNGVSPYLFTWTNTTQTTEDVTNLTAGSYSVIVTDDEGCTNSQLYTVSQPADILYSFPYVQNAACGQSNGQVAVLAAGGVPGYSYLWSTGSVNDTITGLSAGSYTVTITDSKGCVKTGIANISNLTGPSITSIDSANVTCHGGNDGYIDVTATGVSLPLTYSWSTLPAVTPGVSNLSAGSYTITIADNAGCLLVRTIIITAPDSFTVNSVIPQNNPPYNISCYGLSDGTLNLSVTGGNPPYSFIWSNGAITQNLLNIPASNYSVSITDSKGCTAARSFTLSQPPLLVADAGADIVICGQPSIQLQADTPAVGIGFWQVVNSAGTIVFTDASSPSSSISGMGDGDNVLEWIISFGICNDTDQVVITNAEAIEAIAGNNRKICGSEVTLSATRPEFGYGYWIALNPDILLADSAKALSLASGLDYGANQFLWTVVNGTCRDSAYVTIFRKDTLDCLSKVQLPNAFSPNFDGFNDFLIVKGLEDYPDNTLEIYNRWGQLVFSKTGYMNDWYGLDAEGVPLPDGTYFMIVKVRYIDKVYNSYLDMRR